MKTKLIQLAFGNIEDPKTQNAKKERWFSSHNTKREHILAKGAWPENWYMFCVVLLKSPFFLTFCLFGSCRHGDILEQSPLFLTFCVFSSC